MLSIITVVSHLLISLITILSNAHTKIAAYFDDYAGDYESWAQIFENLMKLSKKELLVFLEKIWVELKTVEKLKHTIFTWGMDLALLAFSIDFAILASWMMDKECFPFFSKWNSDVLYLEAPIWTLVFFAHLLIFLITVWLNYNNITKIESSRSKLIPLSAIFSNGWLGQYNYFIISLFLGFISVTSNFIIITNSI